MPSASDMAHPIPTEGRKVITMEWYPFYPTLYRADTLDLTLEQDGAYRRLIDYYMETRSPLPNNQQALARIVGISVNEWVAIAEQLLSKCITKGDYLHIKRCDLELNKQDDISHKRSEVAKAGAKKRWGKQEVTGNSKAIAKQTHAIGQDRTGQEKEVYTAEFEEFWAAYPRRVGKQAAFYAWRKVKQRRTDTAAIIEAAGRFKVQTEGTERQFVPHPATWLNHGRYMDEPDRAPKPNKNMLAG